MSEHNYAGLIFNEGLKRNPNFFDHLDEEKQHKRTVAVIAASQALHAKNDATKRSEPRAEYNKLRKQLFDAQQWAKNAEIYCNNKAGEVKQLEGRITDLLKQKKAAVDNPLAERNLEHRIQLLETELIDAKVELNRAKTQSGNAARGLKAFDVHVRIVELKQELGE